MTDTANLALPCIEGSQAQKHITHNDALRILDTLVQLAVLDRDLAAPPGMPAEGQRWIVKAAGTDAWTGHDHAIAAWQDDGWQFSAPQTGWVAFVEDEGTLLVWNGAAWGDFFSTVTAIQNLALLGIGTTADATNPLSAKLNNALFTAKTVAEGGDGTLRYKLSKEDAAKTLSFLFQNNYSGRAEIGLTGDDDFHFKVSPDGTAWYEGLKIAAATGKVSFPVSGGPRELLTANRTYYVRTDGSDSNNGLSDTSGGAFLTVQKAIDTAAALDSNIYDATIQCGAGTFSLGTGLIGKNMIGAGAIIIIGDETTPSNVVFDCNSSNGQIFNATKLSTIYHLRGVKMTASGGGTAFGIQSQSQSYVKFQNIDLGTGLSQQLRAADYGILEATGNYIISAGGAFHWSAVLGKIRVTGKTITLTGTPAFASAFVLADQLAEVQANSNTFLGSATGSRYSATLNGLINTGGAGANYFPGNSVGSTSNQGLYV